MPARTLAVRQTPAPAPAWTGAAAATLDSEQQPRHIYDVGGDRGQRLTTIHR